MDSSILRAGALRTLAVAWVAGLLFVGPAVAEPEDPAEAEAPAEEVNPDESLAKSLLGKEYEGELEVEGWTNFGGGLVSPPIYVNLYQREDGTSLVVTSKLSSQKYVVIDTLIVSKPWKGYAISTSCTKGDDFMLRFVGEARGPEDKEWWTEVRRAWEIAVEPEPAPEGEAETEAQTEPEPEAETEAESAPKPAIGTISKTDARGVKCASPNW